MRQLLTYVFFVVSMVALAASALAPHIISRWERHSKEFGRVTHEMLEEDIQLTGLIKEAIAHGDEREADRLKDQRKAIAERRRQRVRGLGAGE